MAGAWLVQQRGRESLVSPDELKAQARDGKIDRDDLVYHPVLGRWLYAHQVDEITVEMNAPLVAISGKYNDSAVAGFTLGVLAVLPVFGLLCALVGLPLSLRGLRRAKLLGGVDRGLAIAGTALAIGALVVNGGATLFAIFCLRSA